MRLPHVPPCLCLEVPMFDLTSSIQQFAMNDSSMGVEYDHERTEHYDVGEMSLKILLIVLKQFVS